jgi:miniconductance mechanosensitive channel
MQASTIQFIILDIINAMFQYPEPAITMQDTSYKLAAIIILLLTAMVILWTIKFLVGSNLLKLLLRNNQEWDDVLYEQGFFNRLEHIIPALFIFASAPILLEFNTLLLGFVLKCAQIYLVIFSIFALFSLLNTIEVLY